MARPNLLGRHVATRRSGPISGHPANGRATLADDDQGGRDANPQCRDSTVRTRGGCSQAYRRNAAGAARADATCTPGRSTALLHVESTPQATSLLLRSHGWQRTRPGVLRRLEMGTSRHRHVGLHEAMRSRSVATSSERNATSPAADKNVPHHANPYPEHTRSG